MMCQLLWAASCPVLQQFGNWLCYPNTSIFTIELKLNPISCILLVGSAHSNSHKFLLRKSVLIPIICYVYTAHVNGPHFHCFQHIPPGIQKLSFPIYIILDQWLARLAHINWDWQIIQPICQELGVFVLC